MKVLLLVPLLLAATPPDSSWATPPRRPPERAAPAAVAGPAGVQPGALVDYDWRVRGLDGRVTSLAAHRGRVVVVNVWATWCRPCVEELASLQAAADSLRASDVRFVLVAPQAARTVRPFVRRRGLRLPVYVEHDPIPALFGLRAIPSTYVVGRDGRIAIAHRGAARWDAPPVLAAIRALAAAPEAAR